MVEKGNVIISVISSLLVPAAIVIRLVQSLFRKKK